MTNNSLTGGTRESIVGVHDVEDVVLVGFVERKRAE